MENVLEFEQTKKFIKALGKDIEAYFGKDDSCIVCLEPDGVFYGYALYAWLKERKENVVVTSIGDKGVTLDESKIKGRKLLLVANDVVTGRGYKRAMEILRVRKNPLGIKDIKLASSSDRVGVADFFVTKHSAEEIWHVEELDAIDLKIIQCLSENGRESFAEIGKKVHLSSVAVKNRVDKLFKENILKIEGTLNIGQFYTLSAQIGVEADKETVERFIEKFEKSQEVYHLVRTVSGRYTLVIGILAHNLENIEKFIENEIRNARIVFPKICFDIFT